MIQVCSRKVRWLWLVPISILALTQSCATSTGTTGSPAGDLSALRSALDVTTADAKLRVVGPAQGVADAPCLGDGPPLHHASVTLVVDLQGEDATQVSRRVADVWRQRKDEWFGGGLTLNDSKVSNPGYARVGLSKDGWALAAAVPDNKERGQYEVSASAPCR